MYFYLLFFVWLFFTKTASSLPQYEVSSNPDDPTDSTDYLEDDPSLHLADLGTDDTGNIQPVGVESQDYPINVPDLVTEDTESTQQVDAESPDPNSVQTFSLENNDIANTACASDISPSKDRKRVVAPDICKPKKKQDLDTIPPFTVPRMKGPNNEKCPDRKVAYCCDIYGVSVPGIYGFLREYCDIYTTLEACKNMQDIAPDHKSEGEFDCCLRRLKAPSLRTGDVVDWGVGCGKGTNYQPPQKPQPQKPGPQTPEERVDCLSQPQLPRCISGPEKDPSRKPPKYIPPWPGH